MLQLSRKKGANKTEQIESKRFWPFLSGTRFDPEAIECITDWLTCDASVSQTFVKTVQLHTTRFMLLSLQAIVCLCCIFILLCYTQLHQYVLHSMTERERGAEWERKAKCFIKRKLCNNRLKDADKPEMNSTSSSSERFKMAVSLAKKLEVSFRIKTIIHLFFFVGVCIFSLEWMTGRLNWHDANGKIK